MELYLEKYSKKNSEWESFEILNLKKVTESTNVLLVFDGEMSFSLKDENVNQENNFYQIYKVQFFAVCDIKIAKSVLLAFCIDECGQLTPYVISDLPNDYCQAETTRFFLIDYKGYLEICDITKEKKLSFEEYLEEKKSGNQFPNSFLKYENKYYNWDDNKEVFDKVEKSDDSRFDALEKLDEISIKN
ncbi:hypothetical protein E0I26_02400 [Flavobacterium rhamnosiphilum]|uniref:Uncharacterized protein n=1 Tax=Flavobacterium rhamnosiphilum TaxID=2541724 RepID=A0A4R5FDN7_9FLAO|nr:hypothetical protein [Flavobacterium rhamnosiphilum]TDE46958.1 hypothetical protein E0I26_02400 [Flavobacterium rhamnosiphilum]